MAEHQQRGLPRPRGKVWAWALVAAWTATAAASLVWNLYQEREEVVESARVQARTAHEKDFIYRGWLSNHGGVYVWVTDETQPNPFLQHLPERDIYTPWGNLTLVNPATVTRQVHEMEAESYEVRSRIVSLDPVNPANAADTWESRALEAFERGIAEVSSTEQMAGRPYMRLMRPLPTEKSCLKCHGSQGYQVGDIRGGISVAVPIEPLWAAAKMHMLTLSAGHGLLWLLGLGGICWAVQNIRKRERERLRAEETLKENDIRMRIMAERNARLEAERAVSTTKQKLRMARRIQESFLPACAPVVGGFDIGGISYPAEATSGDYYDYIPLQDGSVGVVVADVTGHGIAPALFAAETSAYLRALAETCSDVGELLTRLNGFLTADTTNGHLVTLFLARLNPRDRTLTYASAGHQSYVLSATGAVRMLHATGVPLGVMPTTVYPSSSPLALEPADLALFVTDGVIEASDGNGRLFGRRRMLDVVKANQSKQPREIADLIYRSAREFSDGTPQRDDITAVVAKVG